MPRKTGCFVGAFFFASATDENRVQQVLFSFSFRVLFCVTDAEGSTACAFETFHTWFEKVINFRWCRIGEETFPIVVPVVLPHHPFSAHVFVVLVSEFFLKVGKSREKGICFEFMLWILNEFLRVFLQGGLTGFRFKLLMNDGVDWVSRFTRLVLCGETRTRTEDGVNGRQGRRRWRASAITFLMPDHARDEFPEDGCAKT